MPPPPNSAVDVPAEIAGRWRSGVVLKRDVFSTVERGRFRGPQGEVEAVLRRIDQVPWWAPPLARHLFARERKALAVAGELGIAPPLLFAGRRALVRGWIDGVPLHIAKPHGDAAYFLSAKAALRKLHRAGICHNDLPRSRTGCAAATAAPISPISSWPCASRRRGRLFRIAAYEDLRHLLKHKRRYAPEALTAAERRVLARKSLPTRVWMATGKKVYYWITRGLFRFTDREGGGPRLVHDAPQIAARLKAHPQVRDARGRRLSRPAQRNRALCLRRGRRRPLGGPLARRSSPPRRSAKPPEHLQVIAKLPRRPPGRCATKSCNWSPSTRST